MKDLNLAHTRIQYSFPGHKLILPYLAMFSEDLCEYRTGPKLLSKPKLHLTGGRLLSKNQAQLDSAHPWRMRHEDHFLEDCKSPPSTFIYILNARHTNKLNETAMFPCTPHGAIHHDGIMKYHESDSPGIAGRGCGNYSGRERWVGQILVVVFYHSPIILCTSLHFFSATCSYLYPCTICTKIIEHLDGLHNACARMEAAQLSARVRSAQAEPFQLCPSDLS